MTLNTLDLIILAVIGLSSLLSLYRGFFSEFFSLATWAVAIWLPFNYTEQFMAFLPVTVESPSARWFISAGTLFIGAMMVGGILSFMLRKILGATGLGLADRILGVGIGVVRGILIVAIVALLATSNPSIPKEKWWNESKLLPPVLRLSQVIQNRLPASFSKWFEASSV